MDTDIESVDFISRFLDSIAHKRLFFLSTAANNSGAREGANKQSRWFSWVGALIIMTTVMKAIWGEERRGEELSGIGETGEK